MHDPADGSWREWRLPGDGQPQPYAVYVDDAGIAWLTDFAANAIVRFDPATESFTTIPLPTRGRRRPPAARPPGRGLGRRVGHGQARPRPDLTLGRGRPRADDAGLVGEHDELRAVAQVELEQQVRDVRLHRRLGEDQAVGDLAVGQALGDERQDLALALGELCPGAGRARRRRAA